MYLFEVGYKLKSKQLYQSKCAIFSFPLNYPYNYTIGKKKEKKKTPDTICSSSKMQI